MKDGIDERSKFNEFLKKARQYLSQKNTTFKIQFMPLGKHKFAFTYINNNPVDFVFDPELSQSPGKKKKIKRGIKDKDFQSLTFNLSEVNGGYTLLKMHPMVLDSGHKIWMPKELACLSSVSDFFIQFPNLVRLAPAEFSILHTLKLSKVSLQGNGVNFVKLVLKVASVAELALLQIFHPIVNPYESMDMLVLLSLAPNLRRLDFRGNGITMRTTPNIKALFTTYDSVVSVLILGDPEPEKNKANVLSETESRRNRLNSNLGLFQSHPSERYAHPLKKKAIDGVKTFVLNHTLQKSVTQNTSISIFNQFKYRPDYLTVLALNTILKLPESSLDEGVKNLPEKFVTKFAEIMAIMKGDALNEQQLKNSTKTFLTQFNQKRRKLHPTTCSSHDIGKVKQINFPNKV